MTDSHPGMLEPFEEEDCSLESASTVSPIRQSRFLTYEEIMTISARQRRGISDIADILNKKVT